MEKFRFDKEWIQDQWDEYYKKATNVNDKSKQKIDIIKFTDNCIKKVKKYVDEKEE